jgi:hypothetical protein
MAEAQETRASREEVEAFVGKLQGFHGGLDPAGQAMMDSILGAAMGGETGGYLRRRRPGEDHAEAWQDLVGWIEEQGGEDTQGFARYRR